MHRKLLLGLLAGALPLLCAAKENTVTTAVKNNLHFQENKGQVIDQYNHSRTDIQFSVGGNGMKVFIGDGQLHYQFSRVINQQSFRGSLLSSKNAGATIEAPMVDMYRMDVELLNANKNAQVVAEQKQDLGTRYYQSTFTAKNSKGQLQKEISAASYNKITYKNIYPNIDWVLLVRNNQVEYEFVVRPGGNPSDIKLKYSGATSLKLNKDGSLLATTPMGTVTEAAPVSFQADGSRVTSSFNLKGDVLSFNVANYSGTLTLDPLLTWGTYFGDLGTEEVKSVTYDASGNQYWIGYTSSTTNMATLGAFQLTNAGGYDAFLFKVTDAGLLVWSTFYGTAANDVGWSVQYNGTDLVFAGYSEILADQDFLLGKFTTAGALVYDWVIGGVSNEIAYKVVRTSTNDIYLSGRTDAATIAATVGQTTFGGGLFDGMLVKTDNAGNFVWGTLLGGTGDESMTALDVDNAGNIYPVGWTTSTSAIATTGVSQQFAGGLYDGFVTKYNSAGTKLWGTYWGGSADENCLGVDVDGSGNVFVTGVAVSTGMATNGAFQTTMNGIADVIVGRYNTNGTLQWGTYLGGAGYDQGYGIALDQNGNVFVTGETESATVMGSTNSYDVTLGGTTDGFVTKFSTAGAFGWSTYYGGAGIDWMNNIATDNANPAYIYIAGYSESGTDIALNTNIQTTNAGLGDGVAAKFLDCLPTAQPGTITGAATVCAGSTQTYTIAAVTGATSYTWTLPNGWTGTSSTNSITVTVGTTGGTLSVVANNNCGASQAQTLSITVNPMPTASITAGGPTTFCQGGNVVLTATTGTGYTYQWYQGVPIPGANNSTYTATASGTYTVEVTANGCTSVSNAIAVTVNPVPVAPTATANTPLCVGQTLNLTSSTTTSGVTYSWAGPNSFTSTLQNPSITGITAAGAGTYTVTVTANGCSATGTVTVVVDPGAPGQPGTISGPATVCAGSSQTYSIAPVAGATSYTWSLPTGWTGSSTTTSITVTVGTAGGSISVVAVNGCGNSPAQTQTITVTPAPPATITPAGPVTFCQGGTVQLDANTGTGLTYQWYDGSTAITGATSASYTANASGTYTVVVSDGTCSTTSAAVTVTVNPLPTPTITATGNQLSTTATYSTYQWYDGSGPISGATSQTYTPTAPGSYYVIVTDGNGCSNQSNTLPVSVSSVGKEATIVLYPNPNNGSFTVNGNFTSKDGKVQVEIVDVAGRIVHQEQIVIKANLISAEININAHIASGVYTLKLSSDAQTAVLPFVKK